MQCKSTFNYIPILLIEYESKVKTCLLNPLQETVTQHYYCAV